MPDDMVIDVVQQRLAVGDSCETVPAVFQRSDIEARVAKAFAADIVIATEALLVRVDDDKVVPSVAARQRVPVAGLRDRSLEPAVDRPFGGDVGTCCASGAGMREREGVEGRWMRLERRSVRCGARSGSREGRDG